MEKDLRQKETSIIKVTLYGPESTGKTTLARELAEHFDTVWIEEFAREYLQEKLNKHNAICDESDLLPIAIGQTQLENNALEKANRFLFCDTNSLVTKVFSDIYYNHCTDELEEAARLHEYDLYFLTDIDVPWEDDGLRDSQEYRDNSFTVFEKALIDYKKPYILISGNQEERLQKAIKIVSNLEKAKKAGLTNHDFIALHNTKKDIDYTVNQINNIKAGVSKIVIEQPATINNGVFQLTENEFKYYSDIFDNQNNNYSTEKFVPASGAASRMFKFLSDFLRDYNPASETINGYINRTQNNALATFIVAMDKLPFFKETDHYLKGVFPDFNTFSRDRKNHLFIATILNDKNFDYINKPKGILPFHQYNSTNVTPIEEHLKEVFAYCSNGEKAKIHFTISEEHEADFDAIIKRTQKEAGKKIDYSFSIQNPLTDSITLNDKFITNKDAHGNIIFRPGGHGALLHNLNERDSDIIFIKNIDNVSHNNLETIALYKKALGGFLIEKQQQVFEHIRLFNNQDEISKDCMKNVVKFIETELNISIPTSFNDYKNESKIKRLKSILNRPIRVCGMVKNEQEPGGGPFWIKEKDGSVSLQIVESAQIDLENPSQEKLFKSATHFNPVDLVCGIKNHKGKKFNLLDYTNPETGFIVEKSKDGKTYKAYELPGLWNGSMANWITLFIEVPIETFNPVKTVNDLLKSNHQPD
ncbi:DUF4301 family protein [Flavobacterium amniphilum]|uniref:DUF4301 family protein n=1 Tax=Flavobacterium amniphilum TaxID=1834035 RepID=UPI002029D256|nr:DUF4301 family protein [Flavobacterium amniphilum]MCL9806046.1 DUF4301 family protein [Flavobacterium amniphilum]